MKNTSQLELTIRTAGAIKSLSNLIGVTDATVARLMFHECVSQFTALGDFIEKCRTEGKPADEVKP